MNPLLDSAQPGQALLDVRLLLTPTVAVVGMGYVGLPTALALHDAGLEIIGLDVNEGRLDDIRVGAADLLESERARLREALADPDRFELTTDARRLADVDVVLICVPTPIHHDSRQPDLRPLIGACATVVEHVRGGQTIVLTSTTSVGTTRSLLVAPIEAKGLIVGEDVHVAFAPERIWPGVAEHEQHTVPRVVGGATATCSRAAAAVLRRVAAGLHLVGSPEAAEMTKLYENTFRAVNLAWANEMADAMKSLGVDPMEVIAAASTKPYGFLAHYPGPGVGGHCIGVDPEYLLGPLRDMCVEAPISAAAMGNIARRPHQVAARALALLARAGIPARRSRVLVVGVAFKPGVQDCRESTALDIIGDLRRSGCEVSYYDPMVPSIEVSDGELLFSGHPAGEADLVILHTVHANTDLGWLTDDALVLDCTYRRRGERI
jgi:nucleotide sugar dehydrogenase